MNIRSATTSETPVLLALWAAAETTTSPTDTAEDVARAFGHEGFRSLVAEVDGEIVGSIFATFDGWRGNIYRLAVHPRHRRRGIARALVAAAHQLFERRGVRRVTALVEQEHAHAVAFWEAVGYRRDPRMARFVWTK